MPDTPENQAAYPQQGSQKPGLGFPICRIVGITNLSSGALYDAAIGRFQGKGGDEQTLLRTLQGRFQSGDIVMGDAFFATYTFLADMQAKQVDVLMEQQGARKRVTDFRKGRKLGEKDHLIIINKPKIQPDWMSREQFEELPESLTIREFKAAGKVLITTLLCPKAYPKDELKILYRSRWHVELDIRNIKDTLGMNVLSCKTPGMMLKEIWVYLLAYNLLRHVMAHSAQLADIQPRQLSFKHCLQLWQHSLQLMVEMNDELLTQILLLMSGKTVGHRPGRLEPRSIKRRPKAYPLLTKSRAEAREEIRKNGHPKKLK